MPLSLQHYVQIVATKNTVTRQGRAAIIALRRMNTDNPDWQSDTGMGIAASFSIQSCWC